MLHFRAGQLIGYTTGTPQAHDFDFGIYDTTHVNKYANLARFNLSTPYSKYVTAVCPYNFFLARIRVGYYAKFGETAPVVGAKCGQINQDVVRTISGMWFAGGTRPGYSPVNLMIGVYSDGSVEI